MEKQSRFVELVQDTISRLQHCVEMAESIHPDNGICHQPLSEINGENVEDGVDVTTQSEKDLSEKDAAKKRAKRAKRNARKKELKNDPNVVEKKQEVATITMSTYKGEAEMPAIMELIGGELSEPYSIYTYRYFVNEWPDLCIIARDAKAGKDIGIVIAKIDEESRKEGRDRPVPRRGYIAMLAVSSPYRRLGIGTRLVETIIEKMKAKGCAEIFLETEVTNAKALNLYGRLGFIRERRLFRYYLSGSDAYRVKLYLKDQNDSEYITDFHNGPHQHNGPHGYECHTDEDGIDVQ